MCGDLAVGFVRNGHGHKGRRAPAGMVEHVFTTLTGLEGAVKTYVFGGGQTEIWVHPHHASWSGAGLLLPFPRTAIRSGLDQYSRFAPLLSRAFRVL
jgi:hypothetical protein